jgi:hypothetical protein
MIGRCHRPTHQAWPWYGGRGIVVCERWRASFQAFLEDMGEAPDGLWLDRIDGDQGYEPGNCRWVTPKQSAANRRPRRTVAGSLKDQARKSGLSYGLVYNRIRNGWPKELALKTPVQPRGGMKQATKVAIGLVSP